MVVQNTVANLYNPHELSKADLIENFVVRRDVFKRLFREIENTKMQYPEQHYLIIGQRGMGKTTLLLRLSYEIENNNSLNTWLIPLVFKEEAYYGITQLFNLWEKIAELLSDKDSIFSTLSQEMQQVYEETDDYERACFELLISALQNHKKKLILFIDNMGELFRGFSEKESRRLREVLMTCAEIRLIGASAVVLEAFFKYEHTFYEFFKTEELRGLDREETRALLSQLAKAFRKESAIQNIIEKQPGRVETLRILTGGVLRTIVLLFEIFIDDQEGTSIQDLEKILDRVTPLYKHRMDDLTPSQRQITNAIALSWDAASTEEIITKTRLSLKDIEKVLKELEGTFIIQRVATDTNEDYYQLQERFFNIWYLMRAASRNSRQRVIWLVRFLESWYDVDALAERAEKHISALENGRFFPRAAFLITEALAGTAKLDWETERKLVETTRTYLLKHDKNLVDDLSKSDQELLDEINRLLEKENFEKAIKLLAGIKRKGFVHSYLLGELLWQNSKSRELAEPFFMVAHLEGNVRATMKLGDIYFNSGEYEKAEQFLLESAEKGVYEAFLRLAIMSIRKYPNLGEEQLEYIENYLKNISKPAKEVSLILCEILLWNKRSKEAIELFKQIMEEIDASFLDKFGDEISISLILLIAQKKYSFIKNFFEKNLLIKERFKPLYYAFLYFTDKNAYQKCPPEVLEAVKEIIREVEEIAIDYA